MNRRVNCLTKRQSQLKTRNLRPTIHWTVLFLFSLVCVVGCTSGSSGTTKKSTQGALDRGTVHVHVTETIAGEPTPNNITEKLVKDELALHGFVIKDEPSEARYVVTGAFNAEFLKDVIFKFAGQEQLLEKQYTGTAYLIVVDTTIREGTPGRDDRVEFEDVNGRTDDQMARRDIRRLVATKVSRKLMRSKILGDPDVVPLLDALQSSTDPRTFNQVVEELVALGSAAIPYLIDLMDTHDTILLKGTYPDLTDENVGDLSIYHVADLALGEIMQAYSGVGLESDEEARIRATIGWTWAWEDLQDVPKEHRTRFDERQFSEKALTREEQAAFQEEQKETGG